MKTDVKKPLLRAQLRAGGCGKHGSGRLCRSILPLLIAACFAGGQGSAWANPTGAQVVNGQVGIVTSGANGNVLTVTNSPGSIINWQSFSINPGELTQFLQQSATSSVLNRIVGQTPSQILGALQSNGKVYLINPNGIVFGSNAQVNVGGLVASSLDISNADFLAGRGNFNATVAQPGAVTNQGSITTPSGGQVYLIAPQVANNGIITSPQGEVLLAAGHSVQLVDGSDPNLQVVISAPTDTAINLGQVVAQGGKIGIYGALVNQNGIVSADSAVVGQNGEIVFKSSQTTTLAGNSQTTAIGSGAGSTGGSIMLLGPQVGLTDSALVDASGQSGGGTVLVGGDFHGANPAIMNATATYVGAGTSIKADAIGNGNGGNVAVWSTDATRAYGNISAQGGAQGGNGGYVETSGHYLDVNGIAVNAGALKGQPGTWLLDPYDITIGDNSGPPGTTPSGTTTVTYTGTASGSEMLASTISSALSGGANVVVDTTTAGGGTGSGDITVSSGISATLGSPATLTLNAGNNINVNANIAASGSPLGVTLVAGNGINLTGQINANGGAITLTAGTGGIDNNTGTGLLFGNSLEVNSAGSVAIVGNNNFNSLAANVTGSGNTLGIENASTGLTIETVGGTTGVSAPGGVTIRQYTNGGITVAQNVTSSGGDVLLGVASGVGGLTIQNGATVSSNNIQAYTSSGGAIVVNGAMTAGSNVYLTADQISLDPTATINAGSGLVWLQPYTSGTPIYLGSGSSGLVLSADELGTADNIFTAGILRIGSTTSGPIVVNAQIAPVPATLSLQSGGTITQTSTPNSSITATNLALTSLGSTTLDTENNFVGNIAANIGNGSNLNGTFTFKNGGSLNVGANIDGVSGISTQLDTNGFNATNPNGFIALTVVDGAITQSEGANLAGKAVMANGNGGVTLTNANPTGVIAGSTSSNDFQYTSANGIAVTTVDGVTGITVGTGHNIALVATTNGGITQTSGANLVASGGELALQTTGSVTLGNSGNNVADVVADLSVGNTGSGSFLFINSGNLAINDANDLGISGIQTNNQNILVGTGSSKTLAVTQAINAGTGKVILDGDGGITQTGTITGQSLAVISSAAVNLPSANNASLFAAKTGGSLTYNNAGSFSVANVAGGAALGSSSVPGVTSTNNSVSLTANTGNIAIGAPINAGTGGVTLSTNGTGAITQSTSDQITANSVALIAATNVGASGTPILTDVSTLRAFAGNGGVYINNSSAALNIGTIGSITAIGPVVLYSAGTLTMPDSVPDPFIDGTAVTVTSLGAMYIGNNNGINASSGAINLYAGYNGSTYQASSNTLGISTSASLSATGAINLFAGGAITYTGSATKNQNQYVSPAPPQPPPPPPPSLVQCTASPTLAGCGSVLPTFGQCSVTPTLTGCSVVLPSISTCTSAPTTPGCTAVLPTIVTCTSAPTTAGCAAVLPTVVTCTSAPTTPGCTAVLPTISACTIVPTTPGCTAVLPTLVTCTSTPTAAGCSAVLPTLVTCTSTPTAAGCSAVLPTLVTCTSTPTAAGCSAVLPTLVTCTSTPTAAGCSAVLPTLVTCTSTPTAAGCSAVLPTLVTCTSTPTAAGCSAVLPTLVTCTSTPTAAGCSAVLPTLVTCTSTPTAAGCSAVLPTLVTCTSTPTAAGCSAVLPTLVTCTSAPTVAGCSAVLPTLVTCTNTPTAAGCSAVLPTIVTCTSTPTVAGCTAVLPTLVTCTNTPTVAGCSAVLPTLVQCTSSPTLAGCNAVLPTIPVCSANLAAAGCTVVIPPVTTQLPTTVPLQVALNQTVNIINTVTPTTVPMTPTSTSQGGGTSANSGGGTDTSTTSDKPGNTSTTSTTNPGATNAPAKKLYCN